MRGCLNRTRRSRLKHYPVPIGGQFTVTYRPQNLQKVSQEPRFLIEWVQTIYLPATMLTLQRMKILSISKYFLGSRLIEVAVFEILTVRAQRLRLVIRCLF